MSSLVKYQCGGFVLPKYEQRKLYEYNHNYIVDITMTTASVSAASSDRSDRAGAPYKVTPAMIDAAARVIREWMLEDCYTGNCDGVAEDAIRAALRLELANESN